MNIQSKNLLGLGLTIAFLSATSLRAQDLIVEAPAQTRPVVVRNVTAHLPGGNELNAATVVFDEGRITSIGQDTSVLDGLENPQIVDGTDLHLWPGMVSAVTHVGVKEIESISATRDTREIGDFTPEVTASIAVNPDSTTIPVTRIEGVLTVGVFPNGGLIAGRASAVQLAGWTNEDMTIREGLGLVIEWPSLPVRFAGRSSGDHQEAIDSALERRESIEQRFADAQTWLEFDPLAADPGNRAIARVLRGEEKVFLMANDAESIRSAIGWASARGLDAVLVGGHDADLCLDLLVETDTPVLLAGTHRLPRRRDAAFDRPYRMPRVLHEAGVRFGLATNGGGYENERHLPEHAARAVAYGLPLGAAWEAVTSQPATILGIGSEVGRLAESQRATLLLTTGHPLDLFTEIRMAWVEGRSISLESKQTRLAAKYRERYRQLEQSGR
ncbi:MAG: hypothetical protein AAF196_00375 [Planctomycetota bacterium]